MKVNIRFGNPVRLYRETREGYKKFQAMPGFKEVNAKYSASLTGLFIELFAVVAVIGIVIELLI